MFQIETRKIERGIAGFRVHLFGHILRTGRRPLQDVVQRCYEYDNSSVLAPRRSILSAQAMC